MKISHLEHFHEPCLDLLVYTLVQKFVPLHYLKLKLTNDVVGHHRDSRKDQNTVRTCPRFKLHRQPLPDVRTPHPNSLPSRSKFSFEAERDWTTSFYPHLGLTEPRRYHSLDPQPLRWRCSIPSRHSKILTHAPRMGYSDPRRLPTLERVLGVPPPSIQGPCWPREAVQLNPLGCSLLALGIRRTQTVCVIGRDA